MPSMDISTSYGALYGRKLAFEIGEKETDPELEAARQAKRRLNAIKHRFGFEIMIRVMGIVGPIGGWSKPDNQILLKRIVWHGQNSSNGKQAVHELLTETSSALRGASKKMLQLSPEQTGN